MTDVQKAFEINLMKMSHFLVLLAPVGNSFMAYRSTLQPNAKVEPFHIFDGTNKKVALFNEKLISLRNRELVATTTTYTPFVIFNQDDRGQSLYSGFEVDTFRYIASELDSDSIIYSPDNIFNYFALFVNLTGTVHCP